MADDNLETYLESIGINMQEAEEGQEKLMLPEEQEEQEEPEPPLSAPAPSIQREGSPLERTESFLVNLLLNFDPSYAVELSPSDSEEIYVDIFGGDPGKIIGRNGRTLQALEYLTNAVLNRQEGKNVRVTIDVGGYKRRRDDRLRTTARKAAMRVRETGEEYALKPMNAAERRIIHMEIAEDPSVYSESVGEGRNRQVVVKPS